jgi:tRNA pseudouridine(38-40) synthase
MDRQRIFAEEAESVLVEVEGAPIPPPGLAAALNRFLPADVRFLSVELAARNFDPLGECRWKRYCYAFDPTASASLRKSVYWSSLQDKAQAAAEQRVSSDALQAAHLDAAQGVGRGEGEGGGEGWVGGGVGWGAGGGRDAPEMERHLVQEPKDEDVPEIDVKRMKRAAQQLVGTHDFAAFQAKGGRVTTIRTIFNCTVLVCVCVCVCVYVCMYVIRIHTYLCAFVCVCVCVCV